MLDRIGGVINNPARFEFRQHKYRKRIDKLLKVYTLTLPKTKLSICIPKIDIGIAEATNSAVYPTVL